jgi:hypothetical protein
MMPHTIKFIRTTLLKLWNLPQPVARLLHRLQRCITKEHDGLSRLVTEEFFATFDLLGIESIEFGKDATYAWLVTHGPEPIGVRDVTCVSIGIPKEYYYGLRLKSIVRNGSRLIVRVGEFYRTVPVADILSEIRSIVAKAPEEIETQRARDRAEHKRYNEANRSWLELERRQ